MSKVTTGRLLREMIDLTSITYYPDPAYKCVQFSSYDRRSVAPDAPGWFANADNTNTTDRKNYLRDETINGRTEHVLADIDGPGARVRFGSANPWVGDEGKLRVYVGEMDQFYLNLAVYELEEFFETAEPHYGGEILYGRPMMSHGWQPKPRAERFREMARAIDASRP